MSSSDEDVRLFVPSALGASTAGTWSILFDGSDVGFGGVGAHDLDGITVDNGELVFSTVGTYSAAGGAGDDEDISRFVGTFGTSTSGTATLVLDVSTLGIAAGEDVDSLTYQP